MSNAKVTIDNNQMLSALRTALNTKRERQQKALALGGGR